MNILIHTYGRPDNQVTWGNLPTSVRQHTRLVVQDREKHLYHDYPHIILPEGIEKLAPTRQWLSEQPWDHMVILDDDLDFAVRREDDPTKFRPPTEEDLSNLFLKEMSYLVEHCPLSGVSAREGANRNVEPYLYATRQMRVHAINLPMYRDLDIRFDRVDVMEDFDVTLQFLRAGYRNCVLNNYVTNQRGSNTKGGCSHYRTPEVQTASARKLAELHPGLVRVVEKETKTSWGGGKRTDVVVSWKKAYEKQ